jgi:thioredoxin 1
MSPHLLRYRIRYPRKFNRDKGLKGCFFAFEGAAFTFLSAHFESSGVRVPSDKCMSENAITLTDMSWDSDVLKSPVPVLVDFWGDGCPPCRTVAPIVDALAREYQGRLRVGKLKVEDNIETAVRYRVRGIPMFLLIKDGRVVDQKLGSMNKSDFVKMIGKHIDADSAVSAK